MIRKFSLGVQPGKFLQGLGGLAFQLRDGLCSAVGDRISLSRIASWH